MVRQQFLPSALEAKPMKAVLLAPLVLMMVAPLQDPVISHEGNPVVVLSHKWFKDRQEVADTSAASLPAAAMIPANKNFERNRRVTTAPAERDPNLDTIDGRSAALEKSVQESRAPKPIDGFAYRAKIHNASSKVIETIFWEYQFQDGSNPATLARRQFLCAVSIKGQKDKELQAFSASGPASVVSVADLSSRSTNSPEERVVINRVEYTDGSIWQRKDWSFGEIRVGLARAAATPWGAEMCRGL
jgi:hypothetical protein